MAYYESRTPGDGDPPFRLSMPAWDGPSERLSLALALAQADLDASGLQFIRISYAVAGGTDDHPVVNVQWRGTWTNDGLDLDEAEQAHVSVDVVRQLAQGLTELEDIYWPTCPVHRRRARAGLTSAGTTEWRCTMRSHGLGEVGSLNELRTGGGRLWQNIDCLASP